LIAFSSSLAAKDFGPLNNVMTERNGNQEKQFALPPSWCSSLCRNAMNEVCVESCAIKRDCSAFEPKPNLDLSNMPRFPMEESSKMTKEEKFTSVTIYLAKVVDHLQGNELNPENPTINRSSGTVRIDKSIVEIASGLQNHQKIRRTNDPNKFFICAA
jgi:hypothetical protein